MVKRVLNLFNDGLKSVTVLVVTIKDDGYPLDKRTYIRAEAMLNDAVRDLATVEEVKQVVTNMPVNFPDVEFHFGRVYYDMVKMPETTGVELEVDNEFEQERGHIINNPPCIKIGFASVAKLVDA